MNTWDHVVCFADSSHHFAQIYPAGWPVVALALARLAKLESYHGNVVPRLSSGGARCLMSAAERMNLQVEALQCCEESLSGAHSVTVAARWIPLGADDSCM